MSASKFTPIAVWAYLVITVLVEVGFSLSSASLVPTFSAALVDTLILLLASTQATVVALFYMGIKYEGKYVGLLILGSTGMGLMGLTLFLWGILGVPIPNLVK